MSVPQTLKVSLSERSYPISIGVNRLDGLAEFIESISNNRSISQIFVITDDRVEGLYGAAVSATLGQHWTTDLIVLPEGEDSKCIDIVTQIWSQIFYGEGDRHSLVVAVGGGVVGDAAGFAASTYNRGIGFVQVPTTLLAQVDSSVGGKTAIDLDYGKNIIGTFYQPRGVYIDIQTLQTLDDRQYRAGLAEVVKYGVIMDATFFDFLEQNAGQINARDPEVLQQIVMKCCQLKAQVVEADEQETTGIRAILNYGHTFGHAIEAFGQFSRWLHGEAVAMGMCAAAEYAVERGTFTPEGARRQMVLMEVLGMETRWPEGLNADITLKWMRHDKKTVGGNIRLVLPEKIGSCKLEKQISTESLTEFLKRNQ